MQRSEADTFTASEPSAKPIGARLGVFPPGPPTRKELEEKQREADKDKDNHKDGGKEKDKDKEHEISGEAYTQMPRNVHVPIAAHTLQHALWPARPVWRPCGPLKELDIPLIVRKMLPCHCAFTLKLCVSKRQRRARSVNVPPRHIAEARDPHSLL